MVCGPRNNSPTRQTEGGGDTLATYTARRLLNLSNVHVISLDGMNDMWARLLNRDHLVTGNGGCVLDAGCFQRHRSMILCTPGVILFTIEVRTELFALAFAFAASACEDASCFSKLALAASNLDNWDESGAIGNRNESRWRDASVYDGPALVPTAKKNVSKHLPYSRINKLPH